MSLLTMSSCAGVRVFLPQWSLQNRPTVVRAKPANGDGVGLSSFTLSRPV